MLSIQVIPFLRLRCVFSGVLPCLVSTVSGVEWLHVHGCRRKHSNVQIMRVDPLVILRQPPLKCDALRVFIVALVWLVWPREEEPAG